jgi:predicted permease
MDTIQADLRWALRSIKQHPGFATLAVLTIALGIGANTAIFTVVRSVLLRPLPYDRPDGVVAIHTRWANQAQGDWLSGPEITDIRGAASLELATAYQDGVALNFTGDGEPERVIGSAASWELFPLLGVSPILGRAFTAEEDQPNQSPVIVLGWGLWRRRFGSDPDIVGRTLLTNGQARLVLGVLPPEFKLPLNLRGALGGDFLIPLGLDRSDGESRGSHYLYGLARRKEGVTLATANAELDAIVRRLTDAGEYHALSRFGLWVAPVQEQVVGGVKPILVVLLVAVGLVLLIACVNVANLLLARAEDRRREFAVRAALGAGRGTLVRQLLVEHGFLALAGGVIGLGIAWGGVPALLALDPSAIPRAREVGVDGGVLAFTLALSLVAALLFGVAPAVYAARIDLHESLKEGGGRGATAGSGRQRLRRTLVGVELGLAVLLLSGAGLTLRTFAALLAVDPGFDPRGVLTLRLGVPAASYPEADRVTAFYQQLLSRVRATPGVTAAGTVRVLPLAAVIGDWSIDLEGRQPTESEDFDGDWQIVTPGYFEAMRVRLLSGRLLSEADRFDAVPVAVINETMQRHYWPAGDALGKRFRLGGPDAPWIEIVGVVADEKHAGLGAAVNRKWYRPHAQWTQSGTLPIRAMTLVVRSAGDPGALLGPVREAVRSLDPTLPISEVRTLEEVVDASIARQRFTMLLLGLFGAIAVVLAAVGVYGVMAYWVVERTHEIGVRMALGASGVDVAKLVVGQALRPAALGILAGGGLAILATRLIRGLLFGVAPHDPVTFTVAPALLVAVALAASWIPARRAAGLEPVIALREE